MNRWNLPPSPPLERLSDVLEAVASQVDEVIRAQNGALEELCRLAMRDECGVLVETARGRIVDAHVSRTVPPSTIYYVDLGALEWTL